MIALYLFAAALLLVAGFLTWHGEKNWRAVRDTEPQELKFFAHRRLRRMGVAVIIALMALAIPLSAAIGTVLLAEVYLFGLGIGLLLMFILALADLFASQAYFSREKERFADLRDELEADLRRARENRDEGNGRPS